MDELLKQGHVADMIGGLSSRTLEAWRRRGYGPPFIRVSPRAIRYRRSDVEAWLAARRVDEADEARATT